MFFFRDLWQLRADFSCLSTSLLSTCDSAFFSILYSSPTDLRRLSFPVTSTQSSSAELSISSVNLLPSAPAPPPPAGRLPSFPMEPITYPSVPPSTEEHSLATTQRCPSKAPLAAPVRRLPPPEPFLQSAEHRSPNVQPPFTSSLLQRHPEELPLTSTQLPAPSEPLFTSSLHTEPSLSSAERFSLTRPPLSFSHLSPSPSTSARHLSSTEPPLSVSCLRPLPEECPLTYTRRLSPSDRTLNTLRTHAVPADTSRQFLSTEKPSTEQLPSSKEPSLTLNDGTSPAANSVSSNTSLGTFYLSELEPRRDGNKMSKPKEE